MCLKRGKAGRFLSFVCDSWRRAKAGGMAGLRGRTQPALGRSASARGLGRQLWRVLSPSAAIRASSQGNPPMRLRTARERLAWSMGIVLGTVFAVGPLGAITSVPTTSLVAAAILAIAVLWLWTR